MNWNSSTVVLLLVGASIPGTGIVFANGEAEEAPPNLLIVLPDQWRGQALGFLDEDPVVTPNLDRFATESLVLTEAISNTPVCSPYRAMFMTGRYTASNGVFSNCNSNAAQHGYELRTSARCWSDILSEQGYSLGYIGKWHLDNPHRPYVECENNSEKFAWNEWTPPERRHGFDFWYAYGTYDYHLTPLYWANETPREKPLRIEQWGPEHEADRAIEYLQNEGGKLRRPGKPFALVVSMNPPHMPYHLYPPRYLERYAEVPPEELFTRQNVDLTGETKMGKYALKNTANYYAMITGVDDQFGRILTGLREEGLEKNTIVVFTSDHGNCLGLHGEISKNNHYEESVRVPFLIRWPGRIPARRDDLLLSVPDLYPTLLGLMGFAEEVSEQVEGTDFAGLFRTGEGARPSSQLYRKGTYGDPRWGQRGVRTNRYTMMIETEENGPGRVVLHDNHRDPDQLENIAEAEAERVKELYEEELLPWLERTGDPWRRAEQLPR